MKRKDVLDLRARQATAFLERAAQRLPRNATKVMWRRIGVKLLCKRVAWKKSEADFSEAFRRVNGCTIRQHKDALWKERRERLKAAERPHPLPWTFQIEKGWLYIPRFFPEGSKVGDWIHMAADGTATKVDGPEQEQAATG